MELVTNISSASEVVAVLREQSVQEALRNTEAGEIGADDIKDVGIRLGTFTTCFLPNNGTDLRLGNKEAPLSSKSHVILTTRGTLRAIDTHTYTNSCAQLWSLLVIGSLSNNAANAEATQHIAHELGNLLQRIVAFNCGIAQYTSPTIRVQLQAQIVQRDLCLEQLRTILQCAVAQSAPVQSIFEGINTASRSVLKNYPLCLFLGITPEHVLPVRYEALTNFNSPKTTPAPDMQQEMRKMKNMVLGGMNTRCREVFGELCCEHAYMMELDFSVSDGTERMLHMLWRHDALTDTNPGYSLQASFNDLIGYTEAGFAQRCFLDRANRVRIAAVRRPEGECLAFDVGLGAGEPEDWDRAYELLRAILFTGDIKNAKITPRATSGTTQAAQQEFHKIKTSITRVPLDKIPSLAADWQYMQDIVSLSIVQRFNARGVLLKAPNKQQVHIVLQFKTLRDCEAVYRYMSENSRKHGVAAVIKLAQPTTEGTSLSCTMDLAAPYNKDSFIRVKNDWVKLFGTP